MELARGGKVKMQEILRKNEKYLTNGKLVRYFIHS